MLSRLQTDQELESPPTDDEEAPAEDAPKARRKQAKTGAQPGDINLSADFACNACGISFAAPTPQLFSFNSPQGMCLTCMGLGEFFSFDPEKIISSDDRSFAKGAVELVGAWKDLGRWKRHIFQGVADTMERKLGLTEAYLLETPWKDLTEEQRNFWLWGTGEEHITFTWRTGRSSQKYGGKFAGIIPELLEKYRTSQNSMQLRYFEKYMRQMGCPDCTGARLNAQARAVKLTTAMPLFADRPALALPEVCRLPIAAATQFFGELVLTPSQELIATEVLKEVRGRLGFLSNVGLDYLTLERTAPTLSGGESQRIRLAGQIGCGLVGVLYILDEPSIGLHPRDNEQLLATLECLRDLGNTVVVVEHDEDTMRAADLLIDFGPGPGVRGGYVVATGTADQIAKEPKSQTGAFLGGKRKIEIPATRRLPASRIRPARRRSTQVRTRREEARQSGEESRSPLRRFHIPPSELRVPFTTRRRRPPQQPQKHHRRYSARRVRVCHRRVGLRQKFAGERHSDGIAAPRPDGGRRNAGRT